MLEMHRGFEDEDHEFMDLDEELQKERNELLAEEWRAGELFVCLEAVHVYELPADPSPILCVLNPNIVILLGKLEQSSYRGGFRDILLPVRGWIWEGEDEYNKAFYAASHLNFLNKNMMQRELVSN